MGRFIDINLPDSIQKYLFTHFSLYFFYLGMLFFLLRKKNIQDTILTKWRNLYLFQVVYSFILASILFIPLGTLNGENTIDACIGGFVFWFIVICHLYYNYYCIKYIVTLKEIISTIHKSAIVLIIIGYIQYFSIKIGNPFIYIYEFISNFIVLLPIEKLDRGVVFFGTEPSSSSLILIYIIPIIISLIIKPTYGIKRWRESLYLLLFLPLFFSSESSSVLITTLLLLITSFSIIMRKKWIYKSLLICSFSIGALIAISYGLGNFNKDTNESSDKTSWKYLIFEKVMDVNNLSTMMRSSTIINDMKIFIDSPFIGIGDGLQGYYYNDNIPKEFLVSEEVSNIYNGKIGIIDGGGAFFPSFLSAYGLLGILLLIPILRKYLYFLDLDWKCINAFDITLMIFIIIFSSSAWFSVGIRQNFPIILMLILPIISSKKYNTYNI